MLINLYNHLIAMSIVAGGLYLLLKIISKGTVKYFTASWHYYSYIVIYLFFLLPYHKIISLFYLFLSPKIGNDLPLPVLPSLAIIPANSTSINDITAAAADKTSLNIDFLPYLLPAGTIIFILIIFVQNYRLHRRIISACQLMDEAQTLEVLARCKQKMGISRKILVYSSFLTHTPFLYGLLKPRIVVPQTEFTSEELEYIFCHELTHWKRRDGWLKCLMLFVNAVHWFNPLAYIAKRDIDRFCELSCDEVLVAKMSQEERGQYCELLLSVMQTIAVHDAKLYSAFSDKQQLERRINIIMKIGNLKSKKWVSLLAAIMTLTFMLVGAVTAYAVSEDSNGGSVVEVVDAAVVDMHAGDAVYANDVEKAVLENEDVRLIEDNLLSFDRENGIVTPMANGSLAPGASYSFDKQYIAKGQKVTINAEWTPTSSNMKIGLKSDGGTITANTVSGGSGSAAYQINTSGYYYIYIGNPSSSSVNFYISYIVN